MKTNKYIMMALLALFAMGCSEKENISSMAPNRLEIMDYNDLAFFQSAIVEVDSLGNAVQFNVGSRLDVGDTLHIFVGVDSMDEAVERFHEWLAPDVQLKQEGNAIDALLTDEGGTAQGTVYFRPGTEENHIAEVTLSAGTSVKHFSRITFLDRDDDAWPHRFTGPKYQMGDIVRMTPKEITTYLQEGDKSLYFICIRAQECDRPGIWCAFTNNTYQATYQTQEIGRTGTYVVVKIDQKTRAIRTSKYCPAEQKALMYADIFSDRLSFFRSMFSQHGIQTPIHDGSFCWYDHTHTSWLREYHDAILYHSGYHYGEHQYFIKYKFLLKVDWLLDEDIYTDAEI